MVRSDESDKKFVFSTATVAYAHTEGPVLVVGFETGKELRLKLSEEDTQGILEGIWRSRKDSRVSVFKNF